jgi:tetratricopeptide (TPR) repeat protein
MRARALAASRAENWPMALEAWRRVNRSPAADSLSWRAEARACLALGRAGQAERALEKTSAHSPGDPDPWLLRLEIMRIENRLVDALLLGRRAMAAVSPDQRLAILRGWTLALLADAPDDLARSTLRRWLAADPDDLDALMALERRMSEFPRAGDPPLAERLQRLRTLTRAEPDAVGPREALIVALAEAGDPEDGRAMLSAWPKHLRDARYERLKGRWDLEYDQDYESAIQHLTRALDALPHDTKTRYRLARALQAAGHTEEARHASAEVTRMREILEPVRLGKRLDHDLEQLDDPAARRDLADLCASVGLRELADAWQREAQTTQSPKHGSNRLKQ